MDKRTGEIAPLEEMKKRGTDEEFLMPVVLENLSSELRKQVELTGHGTVKRNWPCPCGSGKKFKHCCLMENKLDKGE